MATLYKYKKEEASIMKIINDNCTINMSNVEARIYGVICEQIVHNYQHAYNLDGEITATAYMGSTLHLSTPICKTSFRVQNVIQNFKKQLQENNNEIELLLDDEGYTLTLKFRILTLGLWAEESTREQYWAECDLFAKEII